MYYGAFESIMIVGINSFGECGPFLPPYSDEEDDVIRHHDLVVVLHASQRSAHLRLGEALLPPFVDAVHERRHLHGLGVSRLEHGEQGRLELLQPAGKEKLRINDI